MTNYDFLVLSAEEFERFTRDLLQEVFGVIIESFATGKDGSIDLRYAKSETQIIIQCKRYSHFNSLYSNLKKEAIKVKNIAPKRYILTTSVGLTPHNKDKIKELFDNNVEYNDIMGKDDLNNLLSMHDSIEKKYYKLWISSTNILNKIINARVYNQSEFKKQEIEENIKIFVQDKSFDEAIEIIKKYRFVIISGIPGIGKTTLGNFLSYFLLGDGTEEFVYISESINEAYDYYEASKKQVFFFDDFLGQSNFTQEKLAINEENRIIKFLKIIRESNNKFMIFTTREYILQQAKLALEKLSVIGDEYKCVINLEKYNKESKGRILYNHIFYYSLPDKYIQIIIKEKIYLKIINHKNYSPRIIEYIVKEMFWRNLNPENYVKKVLDTLDNPNMLWEHIYENQISELSRCILAVLATIRVSVPLEYLNDCVKAFLMKYSIDYCLYSDSAFKKSIKELENTFITSEKVGSSCIVVKFQNPSINDFLCYYYSNNINIINDIIDTSLYMNQLFEIFDNIKIQPNFAKAIEKLIGNRNSKLIENYDKLKFLSYSFSIGNTTCYKTSDSLIAKLNYVLKGLNNENTLKLELTSFFINIDIESLQGDEIEQYIDSVKILKDYCLTELVNKNVFKRILENINSEYELIQFMELKEVDKYEFDKCIASENIKGQIIHVCRESEYDYSNNSLEGFRDNLIEISENYEVDLDYLIQSIDEKIDEYKKNDKYEPDYDLMRKERIEKEYINDSIIHEMFNSLLETEKGDVNDQ